jgi:hypothetical protein
LLLLLLLQVCLWAEAWCQAQLFPDSDMSLLLLLLEVYVWADA